MMPLLLAVAICLPSPERLPLPMPVTYRVEGAIDPAVVASAVDVWRSPGVVIQEDQDSPNVVRLYGLDATWLGGAAVLPDRSFVVYVSTVAKAEQYHQVLVHEFGHVLGLGHVDCPQSVMRGNVWGEWSELFPGDREARDRMYPARHRVYLPEVRKEG